MSSVRITAIKKIDDNTESLLVTTVSMEMIIIMWLVVKAVVVIMRNEAIKVNDNDKSHNDNNDKSDETSGINNKIQQW